MTGAAIGSQIVAAAAAAVVGRAEVVCAQLVVDAAFARRPERFRRPPCAPKIPEAASINRPEATPLDELVKLGANYMRRAVEWPP